MQFQKRAVYLSVCERERSAKLRTERGMDMRFYSRKVSGRQAVTTAQADGQDVCFKVFGLLVVAAPQNGTLRGHFRIKRFFRGKEARFIRRNMHGFVPVQGERDGCLAGVVSVHAQAGSRRNAADGDVPGRTAA